MQHPWASLTTRALLPHLPTALPVFVLSSDNAGNLAFPKGLASGPGRPRVPPSSPVVFDVELIYVPGTLHSMISS